MVFEKKMVQIRVFVEVESPGVVDQLAEAFEAAICPHPGGADHSCPRRWFIVSSELDADEAAKWEELLNE